MATENTVGVDSFMEMYTTVLGWQQYGQLWDLLNATGLVFIPFIGIIYRNVIEPLQSQQAGGAADVSLRRLEIDVISALVVILLAGQPLIELRPQELVMPKVCNLASQEDKLETVYVGFDEETLYKKAVFVDAVEVAKVPIWWYGVMAVSSGFSQAAKVSMPCLGDMLTPTFFLKTQIFKPDPVLQNELISFLNQCYHPTLNFMRVDLKRFSKSFQSRYNSAFESNVQAYKTRLLNTKHWKPDEASAEKWSRVVMNSFLSPFFLGFNSDGLYKQRRVTFKSGTSVDQPADDNSLSCSSWWLEPRLLGDPLSSGDVLPSLQDRLRSFLDTPATYNSMKGIISKKNTASMSQGEKDLLLDRAIISLVQVNTDKRNRPLATTTSDFPDSQFKSFLTSKTSKAFGFISALLKKWGQYPMTAVMIAAAPIAQAVLLLMLYIMLPFGLVISGFSIQFLVIGAIGIFSVKFFGYLIYLSFWIQNMFAEVTKHGGVQVSSDIKSIFELTMMNSYFLFPAIYFGVMAWAGYQLGAGFQGAFDKLAGQQSAAVQGSTRISEVAAGQTLEIAPGIAKGAAKGSLSAIKGAVNWTKSKWK